MVTLVQSKQSFMGRRESLHTRSLDVGYPQTWVLRQSGGYSLPELHCYLAAATCIAVSCHCLIRVVITSTYFECVTTLRET